MKKFISRGYILLVLAFIYIPIFILILYSFNEGKTIGVWQAFSFGWYAKLGEIKDVVINTVVLAIVSSVIATILGTLGAIGIYYSKGKGGKIVKGISQIPVVNSEVVTACSLVMLFLILGFAHRSILGLYLGHVLLSAPFVVLSVVDDGSSVGSLLNTPAIARIATTKATARTAQITAIIIFFDFLFSIFASFFLKLRS